MPYQGEFAHYQPLRRVVENNRVKELLSRCHTREAAAQTYTSNLPQCIVTVPEATWSPHYVLAIDGGSLTVPVRNGFPGAEVAYLTVASVFLDMAKLAILDQSRPVNPQEFRTTEQAECIDCALPGCNVVLEKEGAAESSLRRALFETLESVRLSEDGESLLDTYEALLDLKPVSAIPQKCPYDNCSEDFEPSKGRYRCSCSHKRTLYSTDALRIHEGMLPAGSNGAMFAEIRQVLERLWLVHILRTLELKQWLSTLGRMAIVLDGPLAVFGHPAWLSQAISQELLRLNGEVRKATNGQDILLLGIEKSGQFVNHFADLDISPTGEPGEFPARSALLLSDPYIKSNIIFSDSAKPYGQDTYFGRKLCYKTRSGALIVATLPFLAEDHRDVSRAQSQQYPRLSDACGLLDQLVSSRYPNALSPLVSAHAEAAIPLNLGNKVLERLARELMEES